MHASGPADAQLHRPGSTLAYRSALPRLRDRALNTLLRQRERLGWAREPATG